MKYLLKRRLFITYFKLRIIVLWIFWYPKYYAKVNRVKKILNQLNRENPSFVQRFPFLNNKSFITQCKYWIHWVKKMDDRERLHFKEWNPIILLNEEEWLHLDLSKPEVPIIVISFYWPDSQWISITIFESLAEMKNYISHNKASAKQLISMVNRIVSSETLARGKEKRKMVNNNNDDSFCIDENGEIGLSPEYLKKAQMKFKEYRKKHPKDKLVN